MASFFNISSRFGRQANRPNPPQNGKPDSPTTPLSASSQTSLQAPSIPQLTTSPSLTASLSSGSSCTNDTAMPQTTSRRLPFFFREENSILVVKGNFMTLAAKPEHVDKGEWLAHQVVEQYRLLDGMIKIMQETDTKQGAPVCNPTTCPTMSAGTSTYTWLDSTKTPVQIPAAQYIHLVQKWIMGKITDQRLFPTDTSFSSPATFATSGQPGTPGAHTPIAAGPTNLNMSMTTLAGRDWAGKSSGFPENFEADIKNLYRQMFRCYAHIYHGHWLDPYYNIGSYKELNTCFIHFVNVGKLFELLDDKDIAPMQPLVDIWYSKGLLPVKPGSEAKGQNGGPT